MNNFPEDMRSGLGGFDISTRAQSIEEVVFCVVYVLMQDSMTRMIDFFNHLGVTHDEIGVDFDYYSIVFIKIATMLFLDTPDINDRVNRAVERYRLIEMNLYNELYDIEHIEPWNYPTNIVDECDCEMCCAVEDIDRHWNNFNPSDPLMIIIKRKIDEVISTFNFNGVTFL